MSVTGMMGTSTSGMAAQSDRLGAVADDIANVSTTGYKKASTEFTTMIAQSGALEYESGAVQSAVRRNVDQQGIFTYTSSPTDLAINGNGFFVVSGPQGNIAMTRAGSFVPDSSGNLKNAANYTLLGYDLSGGARTVVSNSAAGLVPVNVSSLSLKATPSTEGSIQVNLPSSATAVAAADLPSTNAANAQYSSKTSAVGYDDLGGEKTLDIYFSKTSDNNWEVTVYDQSQATSAGGFPYSGSPLATTSLSFDGVAGTLSASSPASIEVNMPNGKALNMSLSKTTQLAADFSVQNVSVNGNAPVAVKSIEVSGAGVLTAVYDDGTQLPSYKIPVARVPSPDNLVAEAGNVYAPSEASGEMLLGQASSGGAGAVVAGALEQSTVDLASELSTMIEAQRNYTANSKVFQTSSDLMDVILSLKR